MGCYMDAPRFAASHEECESTLLSCQVDDVDGATSPRVLRHISSAIGISVDQRKQYVSCGATVALLGKFGRLRAFEAEHAA